MDSNIPHPTAGPHTKARLRLDARRNSARAWPPWRPGGPQPAPAIRIKDKMDGDNSSITVLWVSVFAFVHVFAGYWLARAFRVIFPGMSLLAIARLMVGLSKENEDATACPVPADEDDDCRRTVPQSAPATPEAKGRVEGEFPPCSRPCALVGNRLLLSGPE